MIFNEKKKVLSFDNDGRGQKVGLEVKGLFCCHSCCSSFGDEHGV